MIFSTTVPPYYFVKDENCEAGDGQQVGVKGPTSEGCERLDISTGGAEERAISTHQHSAINRHKGSCRGLVMLRGRKTAQKKGTKKTCLKVTSWS
jgi:hypothetical protein